MFLFNLLWKPNANLSLLIISLFLSHPDIMLFIVSQLEANSLTFLPVISILASPPKCVNLMDVSPLILVSTSLTYIRNNNSPRMDLCRAHY
jgi:hypothetical protein